MMHSNEVLQVFNPKIIEHVKVAIYIYLYHI
jgi:hypothetical protein